MGEGLSFAKGKDGVRPTSCLTQSHWFYYFCLGMELQKGSLSQLDQAVRMSAIVHLFHLVNADAQCAEESGYGGRVCVCSYCSLIARSQRVLC